MAGPCSWRIGSLSSGFGVYARFGQSQQEKWWCFLRKMANLPFVSLYLWCFLADFCISEFSQVPFPKYLQKQYPGLKTPSCCTAGCSSRHRWGGNGLLGAWTSSHRTLRCRFIDFLCSCCEHRCRKGTTDYMCLYIYIYIYIHTCIICIYIYRYVHI